LHWEYGDFSDYSDKKQEIKFYNMIHFIINPASSSGKGLDVWKRVRRILKEEKITYEAHIMKTAEATRELVWKLTAPGQPECHLIVLGGDGTLNVVLNGIQCFENTILSCIRTGSGNDFARNMKIPKDVDKALYGILHNENEICLDYGEVTYEDASSGEKKTKRFIISSGVGYDADICEEANRSRLKEKLNKVHLGTLVYVAIGVKQIFTRDAVKAVIRMDDEKVIHVPGLFFAVGMIHEKEGGGVPFCPHANPTDGKFQVCLVQNMAKWKLLLAVMLVYVRKHLMFKNITEHECRKLHVKLEKPQWFHMDGETPCKVKRLSMECKQGLRFR
jgi:YegS/Rv2252/BmrU family lipid kinase